MEQNEVSFSEFARLLGVRPSYVTKLKDQGRLVLTEDGKRVKVEESRALIKTTEGRREDVAQRHRETRASATETAQEDETEVRADTAEETVQKLLRALTSPRIEETLKAIPTAANLVKAISEARRISALADQEEMNRDQQAGNLIAREDYDFAARDFGATFRALMENLANRMAPIVYPLTTLEETHSAIAEVAEELQHEMAETMKRRAEEMAANG